MTTIRTRWIIICATVILVLVVSNIWIYQAMQRHIDTLDEHKRTLQNEIAQQQQEILSLESGIASLQEDIANLSRFYEQLRTPYGPIPASKDGWLGEWYSVRTFSGTEQMTTEAFHITGRVWRLNFGYTAAEDEYMQFWIYQECEGNQILVRTASFECEGNSATFYVIGWSADFSICIEPSKEFLWALNIEEHW